MDGDALAPVETPPAATVEAVHATLFPHRVGIAFRCASQVHGPDAGE